MSETVKLLKDLRVTDLKAQLEKRGLTTSGVKAVLAERLQKHLEDEGIDVEAYDFNQQGDDPKIGDDSALEDEEAEKKESKGDEEAVVGNGEPINDEEKPTDTKDEETSNEASEKRAVEEEKIDPVEDDSINIMLGEDEDNLFDEDKKEPTTSMADTLPRTASPPKPETAPVVQPFTSRDTISLASRSHKAPSENSSMRVAIDESESVGTQESLDGMNSVKDEKQPNGDASSKEKESAHSNEKDVGDSKNLWVSGLSSSVRAADLKAAFAKFGKVTAAKVVTSAKTPGARCYGYVIMTSPEEAIKCVSELNKTKLGDKIITVERAKPDSQAPPKVAKSNLERKPKEEAANETAKPSTSKDSTTGSKDEKSDSSSTADKKRSRSRDHSDRGRSRDQTDRARSRDQADRGRSRDQADRGRSRDLGNKEPANRPHQRHRSPPIRNRSPGKRPVHERLSMRSPERADRAPRPDVLTFAQIREARERERAREEERRRRQRELERREEEERRLRETERRRRAEEESLKAMRDELRREREKIEREKAELIRLERERQRVERERLQREKEELERLRRQQATRIDEVRRGVKRPPPMDEGHHRDPYYDDRAKRSSAGSASGGGRYEHRGYEGRGSSSSYDHNEGRGSSSRYQSSSSSRNDYHAHRDAPPPPRGSDRDHRGASSRSGYGPWAGPPGVVPQGGSNVAKGSYPPLMGSTPQPPQPPVLSGGGPVPGASNFGSGSGSSGGPSNMGYGGRGGQSSYGGSDSRYDFKNPMLGGGSKRY